MFSQDNQQEVKQEWEMKSLPCSLVNSNPL